MDKQKNTLKITGNLHDGKYFRQNGRWAKVMVTKFITMPTLISCAMGYDGEFKAFVVYDEYTMQKDAGWAAKNWVETGREVF